ncbi:hypothetical protein Mapa_013091 [Marchantia paleacea]|nr:hypothetical protein Mapa_013091 [Marchantia paleacea]
MGSGGLATHTSRRATLSMESRLCCCPLLSLEHDQFLLAMSGVGSVSLLRMRDVCEGPSQSLLHLIKLRVSIAHTILQPREESIIFRVSKVQAPVLYKAKADQQGTNESVIEDIAHVY